MEDLRAHASETAVVSHRGVRRVGSSYGDLAKLAGRFAAELDRRQIRPGERVMLWGANSVEWIGAFFGCLLRGVIVVPLDAGGTLEFARRVLAEVTPRLVAGDAVLLSGFEQGAGSDVPRIAFSGMASVLPREPNFAVDASVGEDLPFQIVFTSGTTSEPKGIVATHRNVLASLRPIEAEIDKYRKYERWVHPLRFLHTLPLSHVFGQFMGLWLPAVLAAELHFVEAPEPARMVEIIRREKISVLIAVPRVVGLQRDYLLRRFPWLGERVASASGWTVLQRWWRFRAVHRALGWKFWAVICGGASLPAELEQFWNRLGFALIQGYGMTETAALVTLNHPFLVGQGTIGKALPGREVRLSESGELLVRGDMVSTATWQQGHLQQREGEWLATGDLAERSESGEYRFVGRKGDAIVTASGLNLYPADMEAVMMKQPEVRGCAVVPCELSHGSEPVCVVLFSGDNAALQQAVRGANERLAEFQHIRRVLRWPEVEFPYTSTGKLLRRQIKSWACATLAGRAPAAEVGGGLMSLISEVTGVEGAQGGDDVRLSEGLYLDSLGRVQLASAIEQRMGVEIADDQMAKMETLGDLRKAIGQSKPPEDPEVVDEKSAEPVQRYPRWPWSLPVQWLRSAFVEGVVRPLAGVLLGPRVSRLAAVPRGPLLVIANHVTALDGALVLYALPGRLRRRLAVAMSGEMLLDFRAGRGQGNWWRNLLSPAAYWLMTALFNVFPLPRLQGFRRSFEHAGEAMDRGYSVLIFPEGTRSHVAAMAPFRPGIGLLAVQARVPVLPVALVGLEMLTPRNWLRTGRLEVRVGEAVTMPETATPAEWTARLEAEMRKLLQADSRR